MEPVELYTRLERSNGAGLSLYCPRRLLPGEICATVGRWLYATLYPTLCWLNLQCRIQNLIFYSENRIAVCLSEIVDGSGGKGFIHYVYSCILNYWYWEEYREWALSIGLGVENGNRDSWISIGLGIGNGILNRIGSVCCIGIFPVVSWCFGIGSLDLHDVSFLVTCFASAIALRQLSDSTPTM